MIRKQLEHRILIVDDDKEYADDLASLLGERFAIKVTATGEEALSEAANFLPVVVLLDISLGKGMDGFQVLENLRGAGTSNAVIMLTGDQRRDSVVKAIRKGAFHYYSKDQVFDELVNLIERAIDHVIQKREIVSLRQDIRKAHGELIAADRSMLRLLKDVDRVAETNADVLITGETGTGKELVARRIHFASSRAAGPFVAINCTAISPNLIESELFGHEKGAFTGAISRGKGKFELANGGTLFLDEIGDSSDDLQRKLLRVLEEKTFYTVGGRDPIKVDVRVIAATSKNLETATAAGVFREDLFYRLNVYPIHLPPLRERPDDILPLSRYFLAHFSVEMGKRIMRFSSAAAAWLTRNEWRGNIRDLRNVIERAVIQCDREEIGVGDLVHGDRNAGSPPPYHSAKRQHDKAFQARYLAAQLRLAEGNVALAAERSEIPRQSFSRMIKSCGLDADEFRPKN